MTNKSNQRRSADKSKVAKTPASKSRRATDPTTARAPRLKQHVDDDPNDLAQIATAVKALEKNNIANVLNIGRLLQKAYDQCEHGEYEDWLRAQFDWSRRTALRYRNAFNFQLCHSVPFENLNLSLSAVYLVSEMDEDPTARDAVIEAAQTGRVSLRIAQQIVAAHQAPDDTTSDDDEPAEPRPHRKTKTTRKHKPQSVWEIAHDIKNLKKHYSDLKSAMAEPDFAFDDDVETDIREFAGVLQQLNQDLLALLVKPQQANGANKLN
jgi:hypothetical protein